MIKRKKKINFIVYIIVLLFFISLCPNNSINSVFSSEENSNFASPSLNVEDAQWSLTEVLSTGFVSNVVAMDIDEFGNLHLFFSEDDVLYYRMWDKDSKTWDSSEIVGFMNFEECNAAVDSKGNVHCVLALSNAVYYICRNSTTGLWSNSNMDIASIHIYEAEIAVDKFDNVHFLWEDITGDGMDLLYQSKYSNGSWSSIYEVNTFFMPDMPESAYEFDIKTDLEANVQILYTIAGDVYLKSLDYSTQIWSGSTKVNTVGYGYETAIEIDAKGNFHCFWVGGIPNGNIFHKFWNVTSLSWSSRSTVTTESTGHSRHLSLARDSFGNIYIAWEDPCELIDDGTDLDILFKSWTHKSQTWSSTELVSSEGTGVSIQPIIASDAAGNIHCVWSDNSAYAEAPGGYYTGFYKTKLFPSIQPILAPILPNPSSTGTIYLDWLEVKGTLYYNIYRSTSFIFDVDSIFPIATVHIDEFFDTISTEGIFYYLIEAVSTFFTTYSQCESIEVITPSLAAPVLMNIIPNPSESEYVNLYWNYVDGATEYYIYRHNWFIWPDTISGLTPIATVTSSDNYLDTLPDEGYYWYVIVASDGVRNSTTSNCEYVEYEIPHLREYAIISSIILGLSVISIATLRKRKMIK